MEEICQMLPSPKVEKYVLASLILIQKYSGFDLTSAHNVSVGMHCRYYKLVVGKQATLNCRPRVPPFIVWRQRARESGVTKCRMVVGDRISRHLPPIADGVSGHELLARIAANDS